MDEANEWECAGCASSIYLDDGCERPEHGLCWECSTNEVTKLRAASLDWGSIRCAAAVSGQDPDRVVNILQTALRNAGQVHLIEDPG